METKIVRSDGNSLFKPRSRVEFAKIALSSWWSRARAGSSTPTPRQEAHCCQGRDALLGRHSGRAKREPESIIPGPDYGFRALGLRPRPGMTHGEIAESVQREALATRRRPSLWRRQCGGSATCTSATRVVSGARLGAAAAGAAGRPPPAPPRGLAVL